MNLLNHVLGNAIIIILPLHDDCNWKKLTEIHFVYNIISHIIYLLFRELDNRVTTEGD